MGGRFLNIELEVRSTTDLTALLTGLGERVYLDFCGETEPGQFLLAVALNHSLVEPSPDKIALGLCEAVEALDPAALQIWKDASDRCFDVGFDAELASDIGLHIFAPETLVRIGALGTRLAVSIYTLDFEEGHGSDPTSRDPLNSR